MPSGETSTVNGLSERLLREVLEKQIMGIVGDNTDDWPALASEHKFPMDAMPALVSLLQAKTQDRITANAELADKRNKRLTYWVIGLASLQVVGVVVQILLAVFTVCR